MTTTVINREDAQKEVQIFYAATGKTDSVFIQPLSRAKIPDGATVTPQFLLLNPLVKVISDGAPAVFAAPAPQHDASSEE